MRALIEYLARALAEHPDDVVVEEEHDGDRILLYLYVNDEDKGRVIGRDGRCANAIKNSASSSGGDRRQKKERTSIPDRTDRTTTPGRT